LSVRYQSWHSVSSTIQSGVLQGSIQHIYSKPTYYLHTFVGKYTDDNAIFSVASDYLQSHFSWIESWYQNWKVKMALHWEHQ